MDLVYTVRDESTWDHNELRYSIRSMAKHLKGFDRVVIVGHRPDFVKEVVHIPAEDPYRYNRARNIYEKILAVCNDPEISDRFICASDDHFLLHDFEAATFPNFYCCTLQETASKMHDDNYYKKHVQVTLDVLTAAGLPTINFNVHSPVVYDRTEYLRIISAYEWDLPKSYLSKSLYLNSLRAPGQLMADCKIHTPKTRTAIERKISGWPMFSTNEFSLNDAMKFRLQDLYPAPSPWEK